MVIHRYTLSALVLLACVVPAKASLLDFFCLIPILKLFLPFCGSDAPSASPPTLPPAPAPVVPPSTGPEVTVSFTTGSVTNAESGSSARIEFFPKQGVVSTTAYDLMDLPAPGLTKSYTFPLPPEFDGGIELIVLDTDSTDGWHIVDMTIQLEGESQKSVKLGDGIWLDAKEYNFPTDYLGYLYSESWVINSLFFAIPDECPNLNGPGQVQQIKLNFQTVSAGTTPFAASSMEPTFVVYPLGGGPPAVWTLRDLPGEGASKTYTLNVLDANWIKCGIFPEAYLRAESPDGWFINKLTVQVDDGSPETVFDGGLLPGKQQLGIWLDQKPYNPEADYEPALRDPSDGWVINLDNGDFYAREQ